MPCSLTEEIRVLVNAKEVFIPRSAYADLGDISTAELTMRNGLMMLTITGGDASESYVAELRFRHDRLLERRLYSGENTKRPLEVSRYYQVSATN